MADLSIKAYNANVPSSNICVSQRQNFGNSETIINKQNNNQPSDTKQNSTIKTLAGIASLGTTVGIGAIIYYLTRGKKSLSPSVAKTDKFTRVYKKAEELFRTNGVISRPNLKGSLFREFQEVPVLSDEIFAKRLEKAKEEVISQFGNAALASARRRGPANMERIKRQNVIDTIYDGIRYSNYTQEQTVGSSLKQYFDIVSVSNGQTAVVPAKLDGWLWRLPHRKDFLNANCRISLNAELNENLIKQLDNYLYNNNILAKYKMPVGISGACHRPDTYNIYFKDALTPKIKEDICRIVAPYVRKGQDVYPVGEKLAEGVFWQREASQQDVRDIVKILSAINPNLKNKLLADCAEIKWYSSTISAGYAEAAKIILRKLLSNRNA